jgi:hypothetical protein
VVYPRYVAGNRVWVKVMDKNQRAPNPKLAASWEKGTVVERGVTGTSYKVDRQDRKCKRVKTVDVQQLKPFEEEEEETVIAQPPPPVPQQVPDNEQQQPPEEHDLEGEEEEDLPDVDLGPEEEEGERRSRPRHFGNHEGALGGSERHAVAGTRNAVARQRDVIAAVGGDDDTSSNQSGRGGGE